MLLAEATRLPHHFRLLHFLYHSTESETSEAIPPFDMSQNCNSRRRYLLPGTIFAWRSPIEKQYMFSQVLFGVKWRSFLSHMTGDSLREKALGDRRQWRNVLSHLTAREVT